jgi:hypothetical protein
VSTAFNSYLFSKFFGASNLKNPALSDEIKKSFALPFNQFILSCFFAGEECTENDFYWYYDLYYGNCYRFNAGKLQNGSAVPLKTTSKPGLIDGLQIEMYLGIPNITNSFAFAYGAHIIVHNNTIEPTIYQGIEVSAGTFYDVTVSMEIVDKLPVPYNDCYDELTTMDAYDSDLYRAIINASLTYQQSTCFSVCYQKYLIETCDCYDQNFLSLYNARPCLTLEDLVCDSNAYKQFYTVSISDQCGHYW